MKMYTLSFDDGRLQDFDDAPRGPVNGIPASVQILALNMADAVAHAARLYPETEPYQIYGASPQRLVVTPAAVRVMAND